MNKTVEIKTARLRKALDAYFLFCNKFPDIVPSEYHEEYENIKDRVIMMAYNEGKGCAIVPKCIVLTEKLKSGKIRSSWVKSTSHHKTPEWAVVEHL